MSRHVTLFRSLALAAGLMVGLSSASAQQQGLTREQMAEMEKALQTPLLPTHLAVATDVLKASGLMTMFNNAMPNVVGALRVNVTAKLLQVKVPVHYIQASADWLVSSAAAAEVLSLLPSTAVKRVRGPHLLLQVNPTESAIAIHTFLAGVANAA